MTETTKPPPMATGTASGRVLLDGENCSETSPFLPIGQAADAAILLALMRAATARLRVLTFNIEEVAAVLRAGRISPAGAVAWLRENDVADLVLREDREAA